LFCSTLKAGVQYRPSWLVLQQITKLDVYFCL